MTETIHVLDLDPAERDEIDRVVARAAAEGAYLHVEVRKAPVAHDPEDDRPEPDEGGPVRYPGVEVELTGTDGNAGAIVGKVVRALKQARVSRDEIETFRGQAYGGDYDNLIQTCMRWVEVS
jgi:hypothetical protein